MKEYRNENDRGNVTSKTIMNMRMAVLKGGRR
jgi:hypothetical protein